MTLPTPGRCIPAICIQSHPDCCVVCESDQLMVLTSASPSAPMPTRIRCPQCTSAVDLIAAIGGRA